MRFPDTMKNAKSKAESVSAQSKVSDVSAPPSKVSYASDVDVENEF